MKKISAFCDNCGEVLIASARPHSRLVAEIDTFNAAHTRCGGTVVSEDKALIDRARSELSAGAPL